jgi:hypothetical protein
VPSASVVTARERERTCVIRGNMCSPASMWEHERGPFASYHGCCNSCCHTQSDALGSGPS